MMFSVIIPAHNSEQYIKKGIESIVFQQFKDYELIIVCDRCTDHTQDVAGMYGARTVAVDFGSDGLSRDKGLEMAQGDWILFLDDDDWFLHEYCFKQLADEIKSYDAWETENDIDVMAFGYVCRNRGYVEPSKDTIFTPGDAHVWSNCWRRSSAKGAKFGDAVYCSDTYFIRDMRLRVKRYELFNMPLVYYNFMREGSQTDKMIKGEIRVSPVAR